MFFYNCVHLNKINAKMRKFYICLIFVTFTIISDAINAAEKLIYKIDIKKEIGSTTWLYIQKGFRKPLIINQMPFLFT